MIRFIYTTLLILGLSLGVGCSTQTGVRTAGSPHVINKAAGNAVIAVIVREITATQGADKAQSLDALKGSVAVSQGGDADSTATVTPKQAPEVIVVPELPKAPLGLNSPLPDPAPQD